MKRTDRRAARHAYLYSRDKVCHIISLVTHAHLVYMLRLQHYQIAHAGSNRVGGVHRR
jgi:hypothetical protein